MRLLVAHPRRRRWRAAALTVVTAVATAGLAPLPAGTAHAQPGCVDVDIQSQTWSSGPDAGGFMLTVTLTNVCDAPVNGWTLDLDLAPDHTLTQGWSANWTWSGQHVTATPLAWNGQLNPGSSLSIGAIGTWSGGYIGPVSCAINAAPCDGEVTPGQPEVSLTSPVDGAGIVWPCPLRLRADASAPGRAIDRVEFYVDDELAGVDDTAPYRVDIQGRDLGFGGSQRTAFARVVTDGDPALTVDSQPASFAVLVPPPAIMIILCDREVEIEEGGSDVISIQYTGYTIPVELTVTGAPGVTVSPASFLLDGQVGQEVVVTAGPGTAGSTATIAVSGASGGTTVTVLPG